MRKYPGYNQEETACRRTALLLSDYIDNTLSARHVWDVEKHLTSCAGCAEAARRLQDTVQMLRSAAQLDTSDDFMARLHARLDGVESEQTGARGIIQSLRDRIHGAAALVHARRMPALGLGLAATVVALVLMGSPRTPPAAVEMPLPAPEALSRNVAFTASNPFDDPVAAKVEADGFGAADTAGAPTTF